MYEPTVSIITPTHNIVEQGHADDFTLLVNMLSRQTYPYVEHIVIDNASTDDTVELLKEYKNNEYLTFLTAPDNGKFEAMNKGVMRSQGKYLAFLSCDDFYHDIMGIERVVQVMEEENADFSFSPAYCCNPDRSAVIFNPAVINAFQVVPFPRQAMFIKKDTFEALGMFDTKFKMLADYDLVLRLLLGECYGIYIENNITTYQLGVQALQYTQQVEAEFSHIYHKNYSPLYKLSAEELDRLVKISEIPKPLLDRLAQYFGEENKELFYQSYENMYNFRVQAANAQRAEQRAQRNQY